MIASIPDPALSGCAPANALAELSIVYLLAERRNKSLWRQSPTDKAIKSPLVEIWLVFYSEILQTLVVSKQFSFSMFVDNVMEDL
jgi:hypothetical protein